MLTTIFIFRKCQIPVFVCPKTLNEEVEDYKQIFTDIISDRIKENIDKNKT